MGGPKPWHKQAGPMAGHLLEWLTAVSGHPDPLPDAWHRVLVCLALALDWRTGRGFTSAAQLAERAGCSEQTAQRAPQWADARGLLHREVRGHRRGDGSVTASGWEARIPPQPVILGGPVWSLQPAAAGRLTEAPQPVAADGLTTEPQPVASDASTRRQRRLNPSPATENATSDLPKRGLSSPNKSSPNKSSPRARPPAPAPEDQHQEPDATIQDQDSSAAARPASPDRAGPPAESPAEAAFRIIRPFTRGNAIGVTDAGELARQAATMLTNGSDADHIRAALPAWHESGKPPEALPEFVEQP
jgi:hypothetical protein